ncbi:MAG: MBL fold metallo-hydrolase [Anaerolineae bacterium]
MRVIKSGQSTYQLTRLGLMNCYLVDEGESLTLIDANLPNSADAILKAAADIGKPIRKIVITHAHMDHVGSVDQLAEKLTGVEFYASARSAAYMQGDFSLPASDSGSVKMGNFPLVKTPVTQQIKDGDTVGSLIAIDSPGHTRDHISWLDQRDGTLYSGDSWQSAGGVAVMGDTRWLFPMPSLITWDKQVSVQSAKRTLSFNPKRLCPGHGKVIDNAFTKMQAAYKRAEGKL